MRLEMVEPVREWLRSLRKDDPELSRQIADVIQTILEVGPGLGRPLVDSLSGDQAKQIKLKEMRASGTIRIAFVYHGGIILLLLANGDKRRADSKRFYAELIETATLRYTRWLAEQEEK
ncbi:hypothetical protein GCM10022226_43120 [Sphaerisporangium flaviroseum]|uniref:Addiction module toxin RelE n=2 Tax=Sphaerisporangium flaviroseum TaxID=509199 RepID=A0ABP7IGK0_9ACTN